MLSLPHDCTSCNLPIDPLRVHMDIPAISKSMYDVNSSLVDTALNVYQHHSTDIFRYGSSRPRDQIERILNIKTKRNVTSAHDARVLRARDAGGRRLRMALMLQTHAGLTSP